MSAFAETIIFVFGLVALGYLSGLVGLLATETGDALTDFAVTVALPLLLFRTMANARFEDGLPWRLWAAYFCAVAVIWTIGQLSVVHVFGRDSRAGVVGGLVSAFSNLLLLGGPFILSVYGQRGFEILSLIIAIHLPALLAASIVLFAWVSREEGGDLSMRAIGADFLSKLFSNPLIIGILAGFAWRATGLPLPELAQRFVDALAGIAGPLALFAIGLSLRKFGISGNVRPAMVAAGLKLMLMPAVALLVAMLFGLSPLAAKIVVAGASMPPGVNPYLIASRFKTGQALASNTITIGTMCAAATTALWLYVAQLVFG